MANPFNNNIVISRFGQSYASTNIVPAQNIITAKEDAFDQAILTVTDPAFIINSIVENSNVVAHLAYYYDPDTFGITSEEETFSFDGSLIINPALSVDNDKQINLGVAIFDDCSIDKNLILANTIDTESVTKELLNIPYTKLKANTPVGDSDWITRHVEVIFDGQYATIPSDPTPFFYEFQLTYSHMGKIDGGIAYYMGSANDINGVTYDATELFYIGDDLVVYNEIGEQLRNGIDYIAIITDLLGGLSSVIDNAFNIKLYFNKPLDEVWTVKYDRCGMSGSKISSYTSGFSEYIIAIPTSINVNEYPVAVDGGKSLYLAGESTIHTSKNNPIRQGDPWTIRLHRGSVTQIVRFDRLLSINNTVITYDSPQSYNALSYKNAVMKVDCEYFGNLIQKILSVLSSAGYTVNQGYILKASVKQTIKLAFIYRVNQADLDIADNNDSLIFSTLELAVPVSNSQIKVKNTPIYLAGTLADPITSFVGSIIVTVGSNQYSPETTSTMTVDALRGIIDMGFDISGSIQNDQIYVQYYYIKDYYELNQYVDSNGRTFLVDFNPNSGHYLSVQSAIESINRLDSGIFYSDYLGVEFNNPTTRDYPMAIGDYDILNDLDTIITDNGTPIVGSTAVYPLISSLNYDSVQLLDFYAKYAPSYSLFKRNAHIYLLPSKIQLRVEEGNTGYDTMYPIIDAGYTNNARIGFDDNLFNPESPSYNAALLRVAIIGLVSNNRLNIVDSRVRGGEVATPFFDEGIKDFISPATVVITLPSSVNYAIQSGLYTDDKLRAAIDNYIKAGFGYIVKYDSSLPLRLVIGATVCDTGSNRLIGQSPLCIQFTAEVESSTYAKIIWTFGDGTSADIANPTHVYTNNGNNPTTYSATCTALDGLGNIVSRFISPIIVVGPMAINIEGTVND